jgi:hypothetical protein
VKVARGSVLPHFTDIFNALSKLAADPDQNVKNGSELLDRLMKVSIASCVGHPYCIVSDYVFEPICHIQTHIMPSTIILVTEFMFYQQMFDKEQNAFL